ncbi:MAG: helix-turn-helix transcriptional regulator [Candidatus Acidiferrum sp.]
MDVCLVIKQRLIELDLDQRDLAAAAKVTESYISQLLTRRKTPPDPERTDIYEKMGAFLKLPRGQLSKLAELQQRNELKKRLSDPLDPLFKEIRKLILRKCRKETAKPVAAIFEKQPFGELERLVTQKLLDLAKRVAREELANENWLHQVARLTGRSYEQVRVKILEFLDTDVFNLSVDHYTAFLDPLIKSWDIDLATFSMEIVLNQSLAAGGPRTIEFVERPSSEPDEEPGLKEFLLDRALSGELTPEEIGFLKGVRFRGRRPTPLYYYRELQNLRDPLHFQAENSSSTKRIFGDPK